MNLTAQFYYSGDKIFSVTKQMAFNTHPGTIVRSMFCFWKLIPDFSLRTKKTMLILLGEHCCNHFWCTWSINVICIIHLIREHWFIALVIISQTCWAHSAENHVVDGLMRNAQKMSLCPKNSLFSTDGNFSLQPSHLPPFSPLTITFKSYSVV
jgi:hypothetical protein